VRAKESRPGESEAAISAKQAQQPVSSLADVPDISTMNRRGQYVASEFYRAGYEHGIAAGYRQARAEQDELDRKAAGLGSMLAKGTDYADLCDRRGEHDRAEAQRRTLTERGVIR